MRMLLHNLKVSLSVCVCVCVCFPPTPPTGKLVRLHLPPSHSSPSLTLIGWAWFGLTLLWSDRLMRQTPALNTCTHTLSHTHTHSLSHTHTHTCTHAHTHTHTHTLKRFFCILFIVQTGGLLFLIIIDYQLMISWDQIRLSCSKIFKTWRHSSKCFRTCVCVRKCVCLSVLVDLGCWSSSITHKHTRTHTCMRGHQGHYSELPLTNTCEMLLHTLLKRYHTYKWVKRSHTHY